VHSARMGGHLAQALCGEFLPGSKLAMALLLGPQPVCCAAELSSASVGPSLALRGAEASSLDHAMAGIQLVPISPSWVIDTGL
jgi:hypothetical protein